MSICDSFGSDTGQQIDHNPTSGGLQSTGKTSVPITHSRIQLVSKSPLKRKALSFADENED